VADLPDDQRSLLHTRLVRAFGPGLLFQRTESREQVRGQPLNAATPTRGSAMKLALGVAALVRALSRPQRCSNTDDILMS
jgi:hypothetical protein